MDPRKLSPGRSPRHLPGRHPSLGRITRANCTAIRSSGGKRRTGQARRRADLPRQTPGRFAQANYPGRTHLSPGLNFPLGMDMGAPWPLPGGPGLRLIPLHPPISRVGQTDSACLHDQYTTELRRGRSFYQQGIRRARRTSRQITAVRHGGFWAKRGFAVNWHGRPRHPLTARSRQTRCFFTAPNRRGPRREN